MSSPIRIPDGFVDELKARIRPSDVIGRKVKLTKKGKVGGLNFAAWDQKMDPKILDCLGDKAGKWKLPKATEEFKEADITIDFKKLLGK